MSAWRLRLLHLKIYKISFCLIIVALLTLNLLMIYNSCILHVPNIPLAYLKDDSCDIDIIEDGWSFNRHGDLELKPMDSRIFFHVTSCEGGFTSRQACAVESAARAHPNWNIQVIFVGKIDKVFQNGYLFKTLQSLENVKFSSINLRRYLKGTPMEVLNLQDVVMMTKKHNLADLLKYLTLYKYGGVYMDMDFIVGRSFDDLGKNWVGKPRTDKLGADILSFSNDVLGRVIANTTILEIVAQRKPPFGERALEVLTRALGKICSTTNIVNMSADTCQGFNFYGQPNFYPVSYEDVASFFMPDTDINLIDSLEVHAHRMWSEITGISTYPNDSLIIFLASVLCPDVYELYGADFGI